MQRQLSGRAQSQLTTLFKNVAYYVRQLRYIQGPMSVLISTSWTQAPANPIDNPQHDTYENFRQPLGRNKMR